MLRFRILLLALLLAATAFMGYHASNVQLSYEFAKAIPVDNQKYRDFEFFKQKFGDNGGVLVIGVQSDKVYELNTFKELRRLHNNIKNVKGVENVLSIPEVVTLVKSDSASKIVAQKIFPQQISSQQQLDSCRAVLENLPFYTGFLYNPQAHAYLTAVNVNKQLINSKYRKTLVADIMVHVKAFEKATGLQTHVSGMPFIRTTVSAMIEKEMQWFLIGSLVLSAVTLLLFFRSISSMLMSLVVVLIGVVWSLGIMVLLGYKISLLTALIPPLLVVIGIPNCIYFLNKYHSSYRETGDKKDALVTMVGRMGIVTLFCNIAAAIGFAVFALTKSTILKEFGVVAGINIMLLFVISLILIPSVLSFLPPPKKYQLRYLDNRWLTSLLQRIELWTINHRKWIYGVTAIVTAISIAGITRIKSEGFIVDDLPKTNKIYTDLKWFEDNFKGVMPLEILIDAKKKNGITSSLKTFEHIDEFSFDIAADTNMSRPLTIVEGLKFLKQAYYDGDSMSYATPSPFDMPFLASYLKAKNNSSSRTEVNTLMSGFLDSTKRYTRMSINMKDVGTAKLPVILDTLQKKSARIFDTSYNIMFTGGSVTFLEGSRYIINGLKESIAWAFVLIAFCMLLLFRSFRILLCSLIPNIIPLVITAGVMGWTGITLKPSTVLVFSVALGIAIDITIRFLVNYKQELPQHQQLVEPTLISTIRHTGISILYTSMVLVAGFIIFCFSGFGGTKALGWLTSLTLVAGTFTNLTLLPVLLLAFSRRSSGN